VRSSSLFIDPFPPSIPLSHFLINTSYPETNTNTYIPLNNMAPTLSREAISYLAPPTNEEDQYTHPDDPIEQSDDTFGDSDNQDNNDTMTIKTMKGMRALPALSKVTITSLISDSCPCHRPMMGETRLWCDELNGLIMGHNPPNGRIRWTQGADRTTSRDSNLGPR
jgi:hypothetical protein